ncbi:MAG: hypothetical protein ACLQRH_15345 [Acidimicrobiales bacterium]
MTIDLAGAVRSRVAAEATMTRVLIGIAALALAVAVATLIATLV